MYKLFVFIRRKSELDREQFARDWKSVHGQRIAELGEFPRLVRGYVQNHALLLATIGEFKLSPFDVAEEFWFDSRADLKQACDMASYRSAIAASAQLLADTASTIVLAAEESVQFDRGFGRVKFIGLSKRSRLFTHDQWVRYWIEVHGPLAHGIAEFTRYYGKYVHNYVIPVESELFGAPPDFDGIVEEWLDGAEDMIKCLAEPRYLEVIRPDEVKFVDFAASHMMLAEEHRIL
jgi:EthD domain